MRTSRVLLIAAAVLAAAPGAAVAQGEPQAGTQTLQVGPAKLGSYSVVVEAASDRDELDVTLTRRSKNSRQTHSYTLRGDVQLSQSGPDTAVLSADMGTNGGGTLNFRATSAPFADPVPEDCDGTPGSLRRGIVQGELTLRLDRHSFGTLRIRQTEGVFGRSAQFGCVNAPQSQGTYLLAERRVKGTEYSLSAEQLGRRFGIFFTVQSGAEMHQIVVFGRRRGVLRRPSAGRPGRLLGAGPFLRGRAVFRKRRLGGDLRARFDFVGTARFPATRDLMYGHAD